MKINVLEKRNNFFFFNAEVISYKRNTNENFYYLLKLPIWQNENVLFFKKNECNV